MIDTQVLARVSLPIAVPVILAGVRTSAVLTFGTAALALLVDRALAGVEHALRPRGMN